MSSNAGVVRYTVAPEVRCKLSDLLRSNWKIILSVAVDAVSFLWCDVVLNVVLNDRDRVESRVEAEEESVSESGDESEQSESPQLQSVSSSRGWQISCCSIVEQLTVSVRHHCCQQSASGMRKLV